MSNIYNRQQVTSFSSVRLVSSLGLKHLEYLECLNHARITPLRTRKGSKQCCLRCTPLASRPDNARLAGKENLDKIVDYLAKGENVSLLSNHQVPCDST